ncbi:IS30 family transposase [Bythopirellula goksoeyrii]|uniref:Integrase catalytic domain-containing protein n=1 Tax=Bythopirellula goksoeyrii TaxID=1400387 RepID=A0A5B9QD52_9BACT|nr:IS30 family transposase [Bythopirellula goksoeyrii]QEG35422.1 hypothetical protein Pr1d_27210 [Bythopirellula goksoeyrii]
MPPTEHQRFTRNVVMEVYLCDPYATWRKGANERTYGLLKQFFPKGPDFMQVSHREVARVEQVLNERPRKR